MIRKLIYLMQVPLSLREFDTFGLKYFLAKGYSVEVWECTAFLNPQLCQNDQRPDKIGAEGEGGSFGLFSKVRQLTSPQQAIEAIGHEAATYMSDVAFINLLPKNHKSLRVFAALNASPAQSVEVRTNAIPLGAGRFIKKIKKINLVRLFDFVLRRASFWQSRVGRPSCIIYGGSICRPANDAVAPGGCLLSAHALDYDAFISYCSQLELGLRQAPEMTPEAYGKIPPQLAQQVAQSNTLNLACVLPAPQKQIVFLDQNLPFHSDFKVLKRKPPVTPEVYFPALRKFFDELEQMLDMPVIIAAHPRANYSDGNDYFGGRKLICGQTLPLICESSLVLTHHSTAVNIAVMARRPVLVLTSKQLEASEGATIDLIAKNLGTRPVNIDQPYAGWNEHLLEFDNAAYTAYFNKYIKEPGSCNLPFWQILEQHLRQIGSNLPPAQVQGCAQGQEAGEKSVQELSKLNKEQGKA